MIHPDKHLLAKVGQYLLITNNENKILLLRRSRSKTWSLPGGRMEKNEKNLEESLTREVKEETGFKIKTFKPFDIKLIEDAYQIKYCVFFTTKILSYGDLKLSPEHDSYKWINEKELENMNVEDEPKVREVLMHFFSEISKL